MFFFKKKKDWGGTMKCELKLRFQGHNSGGRAPLVRWLNKGKRGKNGGIHRYLIARQGWE